MDKQLAAKHIRKNLERRLAQLLGCKPHELPRMRLGTLVHFLFLLIGDQEEMGGFRTSMSGILQLVGHEIVWGDEKTDESRETISEVIN